ncbi:hypothetical protein TELCIR_19402, partial [Teladorsagia circumcincta]
RIQPASLRLVDNVQFVMGQALRLAEKTYWASLKHSISFLYLTKWRGFDDLGMEFGVLGESFETSVPWDKVLNLCRNVKEVIKRKSKELGVKWTIISC